MYSHGRQVQFAKQMKDCRGGKLTAGSKVLLAGLNFHTWMQLSLLPLNSMPLHASSERMWPCTALARRASSETTQFAVGLHARCRRCPQAESKSLHGRWGAVHSERKAGTSHCSNINRA